MTDVPLSFEDLAAARRRWIDDVLRPWCRQASQKQLLQAAAEWLDLAGRVDISATLWTWAWERFPVLTHTDMPGVNETHLVQITLRNGTIEIGFPDSRLSVRGAIVLIQRDADTGGTVHAGPFSIDDIAAVELC
ncbi:MAG: hypothetical protein RIK87_26110 [Fuerstiella sp.]